MHNPSLLMWLSASLLSLCFVSCSFRLSSASALELEMDPLAIEPNPLPSPFNYYHRQRATLRTPTLAHTPQPNSLQIEICLLGHTQIYYISRYCNK